jgi:hypothetical protein
MGLGTPEVHPRDGRGVTTLTSVWSEPFKLEPPQKDRVRGDTMKQLLSASALAAIAVLSVGTVALATAGAPAPKEVITVTPSALDPGVDQALLVGTGCGSTLGTCHFKVTETSGSNKPVQWSVHWIGGDGAGNFTPSGGTLHPGKSMTVTGTGLCDDQGDSAIFVTGTGTGGSAKTPRSRRSPICSAGDGPYYLLHALERDSDESGGTIDNRGSRVHHRRPAAM